METTENRSLGVFSLAILLVAAHYGLGFLLGTAEQAQIDGVGGSLYACAIGVGMVLLALLARFYWKTVAQIWTLLGDRYGRVVLVVVGLMAWIAMIGIEAVQIIAAAAILQVTGLPPLLSMVGLAGCFCILSLLPVERASWVFRGLLLFNLLALLYGLGMLHGFAEYGRSPLAFVPTLTQMPTHRVLEVALPTVLLVAIDMKCQQFVVQAKTMRTAVLGCLLAAVMLTVLAFLPSALVLTAQQANVVPPTLTGGEVIPYLLAWMGGGTQQLWGKVLIASLVVPALGLGSSVLRIQTKMVLDLKLLSVSRRNRIGVTGLNALLALAIALRGGAMIDLILCFYAVYLSAIWPAFIAYLLHYANLFCCSDTSVRISLLGGSAAAITTLILVFIQPDAVLFQSPELTIMAIGLGLSTLSLILVQGIEKVFWRTKEPQEIQP